MEGDHDAYVDQLQGTISQVTTGLQQCQALTDQMCDILDGFHARLTTLETTMIPIHKQTQSLTTAQKNIDRTIDEVNRLQRHCATAQLDESQLDEKSLATHPEQFSVKVNAILSAREYFEANPSIGSSTAGKYLKSCQALAKKCIKACELEFKRIIETDSKPIDFRQLPWPLPDDFQPVSSSSLNSLGIIAECLYNCGASDMFLSRLVQTRIMMIKESLDTASSNSSKSVPNHHNLEAIAEDSQRMASKVKNRLLGVKKKTSSEQYERGSHPFIKFMQFLIYLVKLEQKFISDLFELTNDHPADMQACLTAITNSSFDCVSKEAEELMKKKSDSKVLILLDILDNLYMLMEKHSHHELGSLREVVKQVIETAQKAIEYRKEKIAHSYSKQQFPVDGGYDTVTIQTMNFIIRLFEYRSTIEQCNPHLPKTELVIGDFLAALNSSLEQKARSYKNSCLMHIFTMNNANYILKNIRSASELSTLIVGQKVIQDIEHRFKMGSDAYRQATWSKLLSCIDKGGDTSLFTTPLASAQKKSIKQSFSGFNAAFEELYTAQKQFSVPDPDLRSQLRNANVELVIPKYRVFLDKFSSVEFSSHPGKYIKYNDAVLEQMLNKFFDEEVL